MYNVRYYGKCGGEKRQEMYNVRYYGKCGGEKGQETTEKLESSQQPRGYSLSIDDADSCLHTAMKHS